MLNVLPATAQKFHEHVSHTQVEFYREAGAGLVGGSGGRGDSMAVRCSFLKTRIDCLISRLPTTRRGTSDAVRVLPRRVSVDPVSVSLSLSRGSQQNSAIDRSRDYPTDL